MRQVFEKKKVQHHYATLSKNGLKFEILIKPLQAIDYKKGLIKDMNEVLEVEAIFSDAKAGERAADLQKNFGTEDVFKIADEIISKGHIQLTAEYKRQLQEQKYREVIDLISRNGIDARTKLPIPISRIELALEQIKFNFDPFKSAKEQLEMVLDKLRPIIPISFEEKNMDVTIGSKYAGKISHTISTYGKIIKTEWKNDGSCTYLIAIPGGLQDEFMKKMNDFTHGEVIINLR